MVKNNRLAPILNQYKELELGPDKLSGLEMGYIYEELLRRFSEQSGEEAGEHFTPREVIRLMVELLEIPIPDRHISIYDPACGTGGMLSVAKEHLLDRAATPEEKERRREIRHRPRAGAFPDQLRHLSGRPAHQERPAGQGLSSATRSSRTTRTAKSRATSCPKPNSASTSCSAIRPSASPGAARTATRPRRASWRRPATRPACRA